MVWKKKKRGVGEMRLIDNDSSFLEPRGMSRVSFEGFLFHFFFLLLLLSFLLLAVRILLSNKNKKESRDDERAKKNWIKQRRKG